jgi:thiamine-monophosphate kinase
VASGKLRAAARRAVRRHLEPVAQLELGRWLGRRRRAAAIDVSDGLLRDLDRLCRVSGVGATVDASRLPTAPLFAELAGHCGLVASDLALAGGEDYVLLFALPPKVRPSLGFGAFEIGELRSGRGIRVSGAPLPPRPGWDHLEAD